MAYLEVPNMKTVVSTVASVAATAMLARSIGKDFVPKQLRHYFTSRIYSFCRRFSSEFTVVIDEFQGMSLNLVFEAIHVYLGTIVTPSTRRVKLGKTKDDRNIVITMDKDEEIVDVFQQVPMKWRLVSVTESANQTREIIDMNGSHRSEVRWYELSFHKKHKEMVLNVYLPDILERSKTIKGVGKAIKFHTNDRSWGSDGVNLEHPMTFDTLAMDPQLKKTLIEDLNNFVKGKDFYRRIGKAWKRGYLLYGPPGTGKSSLVAAMANYFNYDVYDLDLTAVQSNSKLRWLLLSMPSRSILVMEDIDCSIKLQNREKKDEKEDPQKKLLTLSGILNFIDGLWSCCGEERIIIFTTNHIDQLDPALLRPGRMDMHIHMSYCNFSSFKHLALNYLGTEHHQLFDHIERLLEEAEVTPAEVAGELIKSSDPGISLQSLLKFLGNKITKKYQLNPDNLVLQNAEKEEACQETATEVVHESMK